MPERLQHFSGYAHAHFARLLAATYAATAAALVLLHLVYGAGIALSGKFAAKELSLSDFEPVGVELVGEQSAETTTDDGQLIYTGAVRELYIECAYSHDPGELVAFYTPKENYAFGINRMVYAQKCGDGYRFVFPDSTRQVRLDLGNFPSVHFDFAKITVNPAGWDRLFRFGGKDLFYGLLCPPLVLFLAVSLCDAALVLPRRKETVTV